MKRRDFLTTTGTMVAGSVLANPVGASVAGKTKKRIVLVGTGIRGTSFWGRNIVQQYGDIIEFVGLCDVNPGRLEYAKTYMNVNCPVFTNFDEMMVKNKTRHVDCNNC